MAKRKTLPVLDIVAWIGTALILIGYGLFSLNIFPSAIPYHFLNLLGSIAVAAISYRRRDWQPFTINICFALFAAIALIRYIL